ELRHTIRGHTMSISAVKFSPDGTLLASCGPSENLVVFSALNYKIRRGEMIKIWSPFTGELIRNLNGHTQGLSDIAWSADSVYLASASDDTTIRIWEVDSGLTQKQLKGHTKWVFCLNYNTASNLLVSGGCDGDVRIWNTAKGTRAFLPSPRGHDVICQHVQFSPNSKYILSTAHDSAIRLWDYQTTRCLKTYTGHTNAKYCISACFSVTGGKWIVAGSEDHKTYIWDLQSREIVQVLEGHTDVVVAVAVSLPLPPHSYLLVLCSPARIGALTDPSAC
ncbi:WD40-repeat-containing domain protein, partial [Mycena olivaceomarginata]